MNDAYEGDVPDADAEPCEAERRRERQAGCERPRAHGQVRCRRVHEQQNHALGVAEVGHQTHDAQRKQHERGHEPRAEQLAVRGARM